MVNHMVIFKFSPETTEAQLDECVRRARELKDIPGVVDLAAGRNFSDRSQGFAIGLNVRFADVASLETYAPHPMHQAFLAFLGQMDNTDIIVVDFNLD